MRADFPVPGGSADWMSRPEGRLRLAAYVSAAAGIALAGALWRSPLPELSRQWFSAHMLMHTALIAAVAPLLAFGISGSRLDPARFAPALFAPIAASTVELVIVSAWHYPMLHHLAQRATVPFLLEQAMFLAVGMHLWLSASGPARSHRWRSGGGIGALLFTSMHMTLLGAVFAFVPRTLYRHGDVPTAVLPALTDQQLGGAIMLLLGGGAYLVGGLWLTARVLWRPPTVSAHGRRGA